jgi:cytochrome c-type biogenesis protein CcmH
MKSLIGGLLAILLIIPIAWAVDPSEKLADSALEARAEELGKGLRCLVCQSESIEESNADLARDLRIIVREHIVAGDSNQQILDYVVSRYGDYVLLRPPFKPSTYLLWFGPLGILALGLGLAFSVFNRRRQPDSATLSAAEQKLVDDLIAKDKP